MGKRNDLLGGEESKNFKNTIRFISFFGFTAGEEEHIPYENRRAEGFSFGTPEVLLLVFLRFQVSHIEDTVDFRRFDNNLQ